MQRRRDLWVVSVIFFVSGAAGLIYQVVWSRMLSDVFGVSIHAITAVLATYLGGLALGGWALGPVADRNRDALRVYGWLELGIAAAALAGNGAIRLLDPVHAWAAARLAPDSPTLLLLRIFLAAVVVLPPTLLMGATLPAITRALVQRIGSLGRGLSLLYGLNTAGAVVGSVAAGFMLIRALGVHGTLWIAVAVMPTPDGPGVFTVEDGAVWIGRLVELYGPMEFEASAGTVVLEQFTPGVSGSRVVGTFDAMFGTSDTVDPTTLEGAFAARLEVMP